MEEKKELLLNLTQRETSLKKLCDELELSKYEILSLAEEIKRDGINIVEKIKDDDIYLFNQGEILDSDNVYNFTSDNGKFKFVAISDLRLGSKYQQLSILNNIYENAYRMGYKNVIICGNITEGLYSVANKYSDTVFLDDTQRQIDYIVENYPRVEGIKTYFILGKKDEKHITVNKINIGKRISEKRDDMIFLGNGISNIMIDKVKMLVVSSQLNKTYTASYRPQQQIDSFRSEDKPDILLYGGLLQMEKFNYRNVNCISVPSVCATSMEMENKRYANTIGAWYIDVSTKKNGKLDNIKAMDSVYYKSKENDYCNSKSIYINDGVKKLSTTKEKENEYLTFANKVSNYIKNNMPVDEFIKKFHINNSELNGILELCNMCGKEIKIYEDNGNLYFRKKFPKYLNDVTKKSMDSLIHTELCIVSDTHFGSIHQQLHLLNNIYEEAYKRGITTVLHCGDIVDGNYTNRPEQPRQQFLHGFDEQASYVVDMYPKIDGITTNYILGSHDETHYKNNQSTINEWVSRCRDDLIYYGQDTGTIDINNIKIVMDHPGGGSSQALSYKPQKRIEILESGCKPKILLIGHYHKNYAFIYRNVHGILVPALCDKTQFQQKQGLLNSVGAYFLDIYSDNKGNIIYFEPEEVLFDHGDMWDEVGKDKDRVRQLIIKH